MAEVVLSKTYLFAHDKIEEMSAVLFTLGT